MHPHKKSARGGCEAPRVAWRLSRAHLEPTDRRFGLSSPSTPRTRVWFLSYDEENCGASDSGSRQRGCPRSLLTNQSLYQLVWHRIGFQSGPVLPSRIPAIPRSPRLRKGRHGCRSVRVLGQPIQCMKTSRRKEQKARLSQSAPDLLVEGSASAKVSGLARGGNDGGTGCPRPPPPRLIRPGGAAPSERGGGSHVPRGFPSASLSARKSPAPLNL